MSAPRTKRHCLTFAVEDYFQVSAFERLIRPRQWNRFETRIERNTARTLALLDEFGVKATFFTVGWVADKLPEVIRSISERGHEVASKGYYHRDLEQMTPSEFRDDVIRSREAIERASGKEVVGYRVAQGTLRLDDLWALDVLADERFLYDSSLYPRFRSIVREPWRRFAHQHRARAGTIWEFPLSTFGSEALLLPAAGGNYFRQAPHSLMKRSVRYWHERYDAPFNMYFHIWELDPSPPEISAAGAFTRIRQYRNLEKMPERIRDYLRDLEFVGIARWLGVEPRVAPERSRTERIPEIDLRDVHGAATGAHAAADVAAATRTPISVVVPCYNEELVLPYLANTIDELSPDFARRYDMRFVFVDDGSADETWRQLQILFGAREGTELVRHERNRGVAAAILTGIEAADTEIVCSIDCDCTYDPRQLLDMIPMLTDGVDLVTASPYHRDGAVHNVPAWRLTLSRGLSLLYRQVLHHKFATYTSCFRVYRRSAVLGTRIEHNDFLGVAEILGRMDLAGCHIVECPAVLEVRMLGRSKMKVLRTIAGHVGLLGELATLRAKTAPAGKPGAKTAATEGVSGPFWSRQRLDRALASRITSSRDDSSSAAAVEGTR